MKTAIVSPVGTSPPAVTSLLDYLARANKDRIHDLVLLVTSRRLVRESAEIVYSAIEVNYPQTRVHIKDMDIDDTGDWDEQLIFMKVATDTIKEERLEHKVDNLYLNIAGGRKNMSVILTLLGQLYAVEGIFHVIHPGVQAFNEELERRRYEIGEHFASEDLTAYYIKNRDVFDPLLFPPLGEYEVLKIPYLPYPPRTLYALKQLLVKDYPLPVSEVDLEVEFLRLLERVGLILVRKDMVHATKTGLALGEVIWLREEKGP